jgi:hypothetical protein
MIKPTVGRVVWYWLAAGSPQRAPLAAIVCGVKSDYCKTVRIRPWGALCPHIDVPLIQEGDERPVTHFCEWMPYQKGQAAKTEALESKLGASSK